MNTALLQHRQPDEQQAVMVVRVEAAEMDEMWSFVQSKKQQRWLWHAIDHKTGKVLAYVLATHEDTALKQLQQLERPIFDSTVLHRWMGSLPAIVRRAAARNRKSKHPTD